MCDSRVFYWCEAPVVLRVRRLVTCSRPHVKPLQISWKRCCKNNALCTVSTLMNIESTRTRFDKKLFWFFLFALKWSMRFPCTVWQPMFSSGRFVIQQRQFQLVSASTTRAVNEQLVKQICPILPARREDSNTLPGGNDKNFSQERRFCLARKRGCEKKKAHNKPAARKKIFHEKQKRYILNRHL